MEHPTDYNPFYELEPDHVSPSGTRFWIDQGTTLYIQKRRAGVIVWFYATKKGKEGYQVTLGDVVLASYEDMDLMQAGIETIVSEGEDSNE